MPTDYDRKLAALVFRRGYAADEDIQDCGRELNRLRDLGNSMDLADVMLRRGLISPEQIRGMDEDLLRAGFEVPETHAEVIRRLEADVSTLSGADMGEIRDEAFGGSLVCPGCGSMIVEQIIEDTEQDESLKGLCRRCREERVRIGEVFQAYRIEAELGAGRVSRVWRARDLTHRRDVALKIYPERLRRGAAGLDTFLRAAGAAMQLSNPRLVAVFDAGHWGKNAFVATEFVDGPTLRRVMDECADWQTDRRLARLGPIMQEAVEAVAALHAAGVIHGEIRPRKFLVAEDRLARLSDGGMAVSEFFRIESEPEAAYYVPANDEAKTVEYDVIALARIAVEAVLGRRAEAPDAIAADLLAELPRRVRAFALKTLDPDLGKWPDSIPILRRELGRLA